MIHYRPGERFQYERRFPGPVVLTRTTHIFEGDCSIYQLLAI